VAAAFARLGRDFAGLAAKENLMVFGAGGAASLFVHPFDTEITESLSQSDNLDWMYDVGSVAGSAAVQAGIGVGTFLAGSVGHKETVRSVGLELVRAQIVAQTMTQSLKLATQRTRPDGSNDKSFPSGHASATFATATVLNRRFGWKAGVPAYAFGALVAASRIQGNKHYPSDVIFGAAVGIAAGQSVTFECGPATLVIGPATVLGYGAGVSVRGSF
jgi:membrane-associated phospholipid phosphatase